MGWYSLVLASTCTPPAYLAYLQSESIPYLVAGSDYVDLRLAFEKLAQKLGVTSILSTAGGRMNGALLRASLIDEVYVDFFPALIGGHLTPKLFDSPELGEKEFPTRLELLSCNVQKNGHVILHYMVIK